MSNQSMRLQAATIFLKAAEYIRLHGWQEEGMGEDGAPRCSMGALRSAYPAQEWDKLLASLMYDELYTELDGYSLTRYNHTFQDGEVIARLYENVASRLNV